MCVSKLCVCGYNLGVRAVCEQAVCVCVSKLCLCESCV